MWRTVARESTPVAAWIWLAQLLRTDNASDTMIMKCFLPVTWVWRIRSKISLKIERDLRQQNSHSAGSGDTDVQGNNHDGPAASTTEQRSWLWVVSRSLSMASTAVFIAVS